MSDKCDTCKIGIDQVSNFLSWKKKEISYSNIIIKNTLLGSVCTKCMYATIKSKTRRKLEKKLVKFHTEDNYIECTDGRTIQALELEFKELKK